MKKSIVLCMVVVSMAFLTLNVMAEGVGITAKVGTTGFGADVTLALTEVLNARIGATFFGIDGEVDDSDDEGVAETIKYDAQLQTISALLDFHPGQGGFRLSAGLMINNSDFTYSVDAGGTVDLNGIEYSIAGLSGELSVADLAPYVGIGYGNAIGKGSNIHFAFDLGVAYIGNPEIDINAEALNPAIQAKLNTDLDAEIADMEDDFSAISLYPVLTIGLSILL